MAQVRYISSETIQITKNDNAMRIELTPWDFQSLFVPPMQFGLFYRKPELSFNNENYVDHLKISLSRALEFFPILVGRLAITETDNGKTCSYSIECNNAGAIFARMIVDDVSINDMLEPLHIPHDILDSFFLLSEIYNYEGTTQPLLAVQVTELLDGFFIGCTMNHAITDAAGFWHFFKFWSEISRNNNSCDNLRVPVLERWFPNNVGFPISLPKSSIQFKGKFVYPPLEERVFHFSKEKIASLKARANTEMGTTNISSFQALLAHLWRGIVRSRGTQADQRVILTLAINLRTRLQPPLPETYFGAAIMGDAIIISAGELLDNKLGWTALKMNGVIARQTDEKVRSSFKEWAENPYIWSFGGDAIMTANSPLFNFFDTDFGWGRPITARSGPAHKSDGAMVTFRGKEEGSIDISVSLLPLVLQALEEDEEFMEAVTHQDMTKSSP